MVFNEEDKILIKNLYNCKGYSARQLISATRAGLSTACTRCGSVEAASHRQLVKYPALTSSRPSLIAIDQWQVRLRACTPDRGKHFLLLLLLWSPYGKGQTIIFSCCGLYLLSIFFFSSPNLSGRTLDVYHTSTHGVALVRS